MASAPTRFKFSVEDFYALDKLGLFADHKVELWDGELIEMTVNPPHAKAVTKLHNQLLLTFNGRALVSSQNPLDIGEKNKLPQPDVMLSHLLEYTDDEGNDRHPRADEILLVIEVSDSTLHDDQTRKLRTYAEHGVSEYWIADLRHKTWFVYRQPANGDYAQKTSYRFGESFAPLAFPTDAKSWLG